MRGGELIALRRQAVHFEEKSVIGVFLALYVDPEASTQECEAKGKKHATCWRVTSPGTPATLRGVGCARGGPL